jgi:integrase
MAARRSYGTGSLYTRADGTGRVMWYGRWWSGGSQFKRRIGPVRAAGAREGMTRTQAEKALRKLMGETQAHAPVCERLCIETLGERYVRELERQGRKHSTVVAVRSILTGRLMSFFGDKALASYKDRDVQAFVTLLESDGLSNKTIRNIVAVLSSLFRYAVRHKLARGNPCERVDLPAKAVYDGDIHFLDPGEVEALVRTAVSGDYEAIDRALYTTAAMTGLRQGELLALRWRDVDWRAQRVRVRRNFVLGEYGTPKSRRSERSVPMADAVGGELDRLCKASAPTEDDDLVFADPHTGEPLERGALLRRYRVALKTARLDQALRFHDLRHTFGTCMAASGVSMRTLQEWMGHRDIQTTQIYADYAPSANEVAQVNAAFAVETAEVATAARGHVHGPMLSESQRT